MFEEVKAIIISELDCEPEAITMETHIMNDLDVDSLDLFQLISELEDKFDIKIDDAAAIETVGDVVKLVEELTEGAL